MEIRKAIQRRIRFKQENVDVSGDVNVALAANVGERGAVTHVSSQQREAPPERERAGEEVRREGPA